MGAPAAPPPDAPPPLTKEQSQRILRSPIHRRIKRCTYGSLAVAVVGAVSNVTGIILSAVWARNIVQKENWFIFHYTVAATLSLMWLVYSVVFMRHIKYLAFPDQLQIDIGWMMFAVVFAAAFLFYLYRKMLQYGVLDLFVVACSAGCNTKLSFVKLSPLILGITTVTLGALQLLLCVTLYRNPIINPPLDAHGMPVAQDPETGRPLPLDDKGQPIIPDWLQPPGSARKKARREESSGGEESEEEKALLRKGDGDAKGEGEVKAQELGRKQSRGSRSERSSRRERR
ncbi:hypothetical protein JCM10450v2_002724 [Rhodotorula kratochvilovae]